MSITAPHSTDSPGTRRSLRTPAAAAVSLLVLATLSAGFSAPAQAADTISFQFTTFIDATSVGGNQATPLHITYQFSPDLAPGSGPFGESGDGTYSSYGPLQKVIIEVGDQCVATSGDGTGITVFNAGTTFVEDSYDVRAEGAATAGKTLYGMNIDLARFLLVDNEGTMFSSTALPTSQDFFFEADFQQTDFYLIDSNRRTHHLFGGGPFQFGTYDPALRLEGIQVGVGALTLNAGVKASLQNKLSKAGGYISSNNNTKAEQELRAFIAQVSALSGKEIPVPFATRLIGKAEGLIDQLPACS